jgi:CRP-like cAMP-binding protein
MAGESMADPSYTPQNHLLSRLTADDLALLKPGLTRVDLPLRKQLEAPGKRINSVYFIDSGFASVVADGSARNKIEVGMIGREGMTGVAVVLGSDRSPHETYIQNAGEGSRIGAAKLRTAITRSRSLQACLLLYAHAFLIQATYTAIANGRSKLEDRLARWLLMAHDRLDLDELSITHEILSIMLGVRRPGVTVALNLLERDGLIKSHRGVITIVDRKGLRRASNGAYGVPEAEFNRLFG